LFPKPWQSGQAPNGLLKEKILGAISGIEKPQFWQAKSSLNITSLDVLRFTVSRLVSFVVLRFSSRMTMPFDETGGDTV